MYVLEVAQSQEANSRPAVNVMVEDKSCVYNRLFLVTMQSASTCHVCHGAGQKPEKSCKHCGGKGVMKGVSKI
jgi:hypothetical protein